MFISPTNITTGVGTTPGKTTGTLATGGKGAQGFILDQYPNADVAFSLRRLSSTYNGPMLRVRRNTGGVEADVHFDSTGSYSLESPVDNFSSSSKKTFEICPYFVFSQTPLLPFAEAAFRTFCG